MSLRFALFGLFSALFIAAFVFIPAFADFVTEAGNIFTGKVEATQDTLRWVSITMTSNGLDTTPSSAPFRTATFDTPGTFTSPSPGNNLNDGDHYYLVTHASSFNPFLISNTTSADLAANQMFSSTLFSTFYPDYATLQDRPAICTCSVVRNVFEGLSCSVA